MPDSKTAKKAASQSTTVAPPAMSSSEDVCEDPLSDPLEDPLEDLFSADECREGGEVGVSAPPYAAPALARAEATKPKKGVKALNASNPASSVDDAQVEAILEDLYAEVGGAGRSAVKAAWGKAIGLRKTHGKDANLAAAEHFLYSCGETEGLGSGIQMQVLTLGYETTKGILGLFGLTSLLSTDGTEPTEASLGSLKWGMKGATKSCGDLE